MPTAQFTQESGAKGEFVRQPNRFTDRITSDGSSDYPVEAGRYVLYVSPGLPVGAPLGDRPQPARARGRDRPARRRPGARREGVALHPRRGRRRPRDRRVVRHGAVQEKSDPSFEGRATVPFLWDTKTERIVSNDYPQITLDLSTAVDGAAQATAPPSSTPSTSGPRSTRWPRRTSTPSTTASTRRASRRRRRPTSRRTTPCSPGCTSSTSTCRPSATWWAARSPRPTSGCTRRSSASTPPTTATSSATSAS